MLNVKLTLHTYNAIRPDLERRLLWIVLQAVCRSCRPTNSIKALKERVQFPSFQYIKQKSVYTIVVKIGSALLRIRLVTELCRRAPAFHVFLRATVRE